MARKSNETNEKRGKKKARRRRYYSPSPQVREVSKVVNAEFSRLLEEILKEACADIDAYLKDRQFEWLRLSERYHAHLLTDWFKDPSKVINADLLKKVYRKETVTVHFYDAFVNKSLAASDLFLKYNPEFALSAIRNRVGAFVHSREFIAALQAHYPAERLAEVLQENRYCGDEVSAVYRHFRVIKMLSAEFLDSIPDNLAMFYPEARAIHRHFFIHSGPTNSGKTHDAIVALAGAGRGVYLAPLRLLAFEQYERLTGMGVKCSMITGEERILVENATHQSSTIEILDIDARYDVAVIDEAQMAADHERGGAWTTAILGVKADEVHVCCSENMLGCLIKMIRSCGDSFEVVRHERKTPLVREERTFYYPRDIQDGDALVVFSRRDVQACAADLSAHGINCSVIYGNLPYDVRHSEAAKFARGETKVVVTTDAVGMGMNLPIRRVVFLKSEKFDGVKNRPLTVSEVKQIAGRAGRYGIYEEGYVNSVLPREVIDFGLSEPEPVIEKAVINIPPIFFEKDAPVSEILDAWNSLPATRDYDKLNIKEKIELSRELEEICDDKELVLEFISIPIDSKNLTVHDLWRDLFNCLAEGQKADINYLYEEYSPASFGMGPHDAEHLETLYKVYDLLYAYAMRHESDDEAQKIIAIKRVISEKINEIFKNQAFQGKTCKICGRKIYWLGKSAICDRCFQEAKREEM